MTADRGRRGRRDNGLDAAEYASAGDVDPRVGEHLLDVLGGAGIAAYLQPAADLNPVTRTTTIPSRPTDRLYVDRTQLAAARGYIAQLTAEERASAERAGADRAETGRGGGSAASKVDIDDAWAQIVAGFHTEVDPARRTWPAAESDPTATGRATSDPTSGRAGTDPTAAGDPGRADEPPGRLLDGRAATEPSLLDALDTFGADLPDEDDEGYTPPPPPPLPKISKYAVFGVLGIVVGFTIFVFPNLLPIGGDAAMMVGFCSILAGFVTLVWRLRPGDDDDDYDPDDGARV